MTWYHTFFFRRACGLDSLVQHLLEKGCDPLAKIMLEKDQTIDDEAIFHKYDNPLRQAAANGHISTVQLLLNCTHMHDSSRLGSPIIDIIPVAAENNASQLLQGILDSNRTQQLDRAVLKNCISEALQLSAPYEGAESSYCSTMVQAQTRIVMVVSNFSSRL